VTYTLPITGLSAGKKYYVCGIASNASGLAVGTVKSFTTLLTAPELLRYDACVPVNFGFDADPEAGIGRQTLPGGAYAVQTHVGSYADAGELFSRLHREIVPKRGLSVDYDRPFVAIYLNDPSLTREVHRRTERACRKPRAHAALEQRRRSGRDQAGGEYAPGRLLE
jgi:hypothetical protein